jgi:tripartite-type tricarboxylate transporter receptor subunit TctC
MDRVRIAPYTDAPTPEEATGSNWTILTWCAVVGSKGLPKDVMDHLAPAPNKAHASKPFKDFMGERGFGWAWKGPDESATFMYASHQNLGQLMKRAGMIK